MSKKKLLSFTETCYIMFTADKTTVNTHSEGFFDGIATKASLIADKLRPLSCKLVDTRKDSIRT